jgi:hypothetical protein
MPLLDRLLSFEIAQLGCTCGYYRLNAEASKTWARAATITQANR